MRESCPAHAGEVGRRGRGRGRSPRRPRAALVDGAGEERAHPDQRRGGEERPVEAALDRPAGAVAGAERRGQGQRPADRPTCGTARGSPRRRPRRRSPGRGRHSRRRRARRRGRRRSPDGPAPRVAATRVSPSSDSPAPGAPHRNAARAASAGGAAGSTAPSGSVSVRSTRSGHEVLDEEGGGGERRRHRVGMDGEAPAAGRLAPIGTVSARPPAPASGSGKRPYSTPSARVTMAVRVRPSTARARSSRARTVVKTVSPGR